MTKETGEDIIKEINLIVKILACEKCQRLTSLKQAIMDIVIVQLEYQKKDFLSILDTPLSSPNAPLNEEGTKQRIREELELL